MAAVPAQPSTRADDVHAQRGRAAFRRLNGAVVDVVPAVVDGEVVRVIEIQPYPQASSPLGGCTSFTGRYVTDPVEVAAIARRVGGAR